MPSNRAVRLCTKPGAWTEQVPSRIATRRRHVDDATVQRETPLSLVSIDRGCFSPRHVDAPAELEHPIRRVGHHRRVIAVSGGERPAVHDWNTHFEQRRPDALPHARPCDRLIKAPSPQCCVEIVVRNEVDVALAGGGAGRCNHRRWQRLQPVQRCQHVGGQRDPARRSGQQRLKQPGRRRRPLARALLIQTVISPLVQPDGNEKRSLHWISPSSLRHFSRGPCRIRQIDQGKRQNRQRPVVHKRGQSPRPAPPVPVHRRGPRPPRLRGLPDPA